MANNRYLLVMTVAFGVTFAGVGGIGEGTLNLDKFAGILGGMANMFTAIKTVDVQTNKMMGRWFQMYKAAINFDVFRTQMFCPVAYFEENVVMGADGFSMEEAYRVISKSGPIETYKRDVTKVGPGSYWMYTEEYFYPRQLTILKVGPDYLLDPASDVTDNSVVIEESTDPEKNQTTPVEQYEYMVVSDANRLSLMVFARDPVKFYAQYNKPILDYLKKAGFGGPVFWNSPKPIYQGPDCLWPTEREVFARRVLKSQRKEQGSPVSKLNPVRAVQDIQSLLTRQAQKSPFLPSQLRG